MNFVSYCPSIMPRTLRITDACSGSVAATAGCSGAEAAQRDVNCVLKASQTAQKQQQQPLELIAASQLKSLARAGCFSTKAAKTGLKCNWWVRFMHASRQTQDKGNSICIS